MQCAIAIHDPVRSVDIVISRLRRKLHAVVSLSEVEDVFAEYLSHPHRHEEGTIVAALDNEEEAERAPAAA